MTIEDKALARFETFFCGYCLKEQHSRCAEHNNVETCACLLKNHQLFDAIRIHAKLCRELIETTPRI